jgi:hypothetical protein
MEKSMFNLFERGKKGRLFNNPEAVGEGGSKMKKGIVVLFGVLALCGWSCGNGYAISNNNGSDTSSQPQTYQNSEWGVSFTYPAGWQYHEYRETIDGQEEVTLAFSDSSDPLPDTLPPEPSFPIMIFHESGTVEGATSDYTDAVSVEDVTLGVRVVKKIIYYSDMLGQNDRVYLIPVRDGILRLFVPDGTDYVSIAENMITNLAETE